MNASMETLVTIFIIIAAVAIVIQMGVLLALYASFKKTNARVNSIAEIVEQRGVPVLESARTLVVDNAPKIQAAIDNAVAATVMVKAQVERIDGAVSDVVDRTRLQIIRADEMVTRTMDKVEQTTELVQSTVVSPVRYLAGVVSGVTATATSLFGRRRQPPKPGGGHADDEMFI